MRVLTAVLACLVAVSLAACTDSEPDRYPARTPAATSSAGSCLPALGTIADVADSGAPRDALIRADPHPRSALVCVYRGPLGVQPSRMRALASSARLGPVAATSIASAAAGVSVARREEGPVACPADSGSVTVITFADSRAAPVSLWWSTSGCQTLDNGRVRAPQLASPSFARFQAAVRRALQERDARFTRT